MEREETRIPIKEGTMRKTKFLRQLTVSVLALLLALPLSLLAQMVETDTTAQTRGHLFKQEELDQILAPIALYPDALLAQILSASTYPIEVVAAAKFLKANQGLSGEALLEAAKDKDWDPSVKALLEFPRVLAMMDEEIEWTSKVGNAFLAQQSEVMDSIQRLRQKAYAEGNLNTTKEQVVSVTPQTQVIIIESAAPNVVYVPVYDPTVVYGTWWYPDYPPYYYYLPRYVGAAFFAGIFIDVAWGWGTWGCNWYHRNVTINVTHYNDFTRNYYRGPEHYQLYRDDRGEQSWQHDSQHRRGIGYSDFSTAQRFGGTQRVESTKRPSAPEPRVKPQVNVRPLPSTSNLKANIEDRARDTDSNKIDLKNNAADQSNIRVSTSEPRSGPRSQVVTKQASSTQIFSGQQLPGSTVKQSTINPQRYGRSIDKPSSLDLKGSTREQGVTKTLTPNKDLRVQAKQPINNLGENARVQINAKQLKTESRLNRDNSNAQVAEVQKRVERAENYRQQPSLKTAPSFNAAPRSSLGLGRGGGRK